MTKDSVKLGRGFTWGVLIIPMWKKVLEFYDLSDNTQALGKWYDSRNIEKKKIMKKIQDCEKDSVPVDICERKQSMEAWHLN